MGLVSDNTIQEIKDRVDIVKFAEDNGIELIQDGPQYKALCPFHNEKTPSFKIDPNKQSYKCFGCQESGDIISFAIKVRGYDFPEALRELGRTAGVELEEFTPEERERAAQANSIKNKTFWINGRALEYYHSNLYSAQGEDALAYMYSRGFSDETLKAFEVGYAHDGSDLKGNIKGLLAEAGKGKEYSAALSTMVDGGLIGRSGKGHYYERFKKRIIFAIKDRAGRCVGFGGRQLVQKNLSEEEVKAQKGVAKYVNTKETALFTKRKLFFGFDKAVRAISNQKKAIIVEGYTDVMACHQAGIENVIAVLGTAFTEHHARMLKRLGCVVCFAFDNDKAGYKATRKSVVECVKQEVSCRIIQSDHEDDFCSFLLSSVAAAAMEKKPTAANLELMHGKAEAIRDRVEIAVDGFTWLLENSAVRASDDVEKFAIAKELVGYIACGQEDMIKTVRIKAIAKVFDFPLGDLKSMLVKASAVAGASCTRVDSGGAYSAGAGADSSPPAPPGNKEAFKSDISDIGISDIAPDYKIVPYRYDWNDLGNARRLFDKYGHRLKYCFELTSGRSSGNFLVWTGKCWSTESIEIYKQMVNTLVDDLKEERRQLESEKAEKIIERHINATSSARSENSIETKYSGLAGVRINISELDQNQYILPVNNGVVNLRKGELEEHNPEYYYTQHLQWNYNPEAKCEHWLKFLSDITNEDKELMDYLARCVGYSLTGLVSEQVLFFLYGEGRNGKSTFVETVQYLLSHFAAKSPVELIIPQKTNQISCDLANLRGKRFTVTSELPENQRLDEAKVKDYTGGDILTAQFKFGNPFNFKPSFKLWLYGNYKPNIKGNDVGIWRRFKLIPLLTEVPKNKIDRDLPKKLQAEIEGILAWAVSGCVRWFEGGMNEPEVVKVATEEYKQDQDHIANFVDTCLDIKGGEFFGVRASEMFAEYKKWCEVTGMRWPKDIQKFKPAMEKFIASYTEKYPDLTSCKSGRKGDARYWFGFRLKDNWNDVEANGENESDNVGVSDTY